MLVFVPEIADTEDLSCFLSQILEEEVACVSSKSKDREAIIEGFRKGTSRVLVTTTILERGVTFAGVDVFVVMGIIEYLVVLLLSKLQDGLAGVPPSYRPISLFFGR